MKPHSGGSQAALSTIATTKQKLDFNLIYVADTGEIIALPPFADSLSNASLSQVLDMINNDIGDDSTSTTPTVIEPTNDDTSNILVTNNTPGNGVFYCNQTSNGITTNFVNPDYPSFNNKEACS